MAHCHFIFQDCRLFSRPSVYYAIVLNVRPVTNANVIHVASEDRVAPHRGLLADMNVADDLGALIDVGRRVDAGFVFTESSNHFRVIVA